MKEFWVYTGLRIVVFVAALLVVSGVWMLVSDEVPLFWPVLIAFASRVETRAARMTDRFEEMRAREDAD